MGFLGDHSLAPVRGKDGAPELLIVTTINNET